VSNFKSAPGIGDSPPFNPPEYYEDGPEFWCEICATGLFDEEVEKEGYSGEIRCKLCGSPIEQPENDDDPVRGVWEDDF